MPTTCDAPPPVAPLTRPAGLTSAEASARLAASGPNEITQQEGRSPWALLASQLASPLIALLLGAGVVSALLGERLDAVAIGAIVVLNALVGFFQEHRAERALRALRSLSVPRCRVLRDGREVAIPAPEVVPGDVLLLEAGDIVAADARLVEAHDLRTVEALLTGESAPVEKDTEPAPDQAPLAERHDHVFMGTAVAAGRGVAEVVATGMATQMGRIAHLLATAEAARTPLEAQLARVGRMLLLLCLGIVAVVSVLGLLRGVRGLDVLLSSIALAVAAVPEGLPTIVTVALALGVQRMAARHALVRRLASVETMGCASVIGTDKTGTLTTGRMELRDVWGADRRAILFAATAASDACLGPEGGIGDPTELALLRAAAERGIARTEIETTRPRVAETPFDNRRKRMSVRRSDGVLYVKGAFESVLPLCSSGAEGAADAHADMAGRGLRILAVAVGRETEERDLRLLGLVGIADPPRAEAVAALARAREAGIRTIMITGDHPATAEAIAREMGLLLPGENPAGIVYARATAEDKLRLVRELKRRGAIVAMTGDGANDAPALREAHIGIAMGRGGTEVAREAADVVLADDNFATVVAAIEEGRGIYSNIRKTLVYLLAGNLGELLVMLASALAGLPLPLLPLQLLWINLMTDGLPALALVMDPPDPELLQHPPRDPSAPILGRPEWRRIAAISAIESGVVLASFAWALRAHDIALARAFAFTTIVFCELFRAFGARSRRLLYWQVGALTNVPLLAVVALSALLQAALPFVPLTRTLLDLEALRPLDTAIALFLGLIPVTTVELAKLFFRRSA
jgi:Ca2+-transporting ATPase